ncbi:hypothetical protein EDL99_03685 [Ornithobacterium rhinotracheale]|nr:hypothetical protein [Ornithobacterium rhinotracheale]
MESECLMKLLNVLAIRVWCFGIKILCCATLLEKTTIRQVVFGGDVWFEVLKSDNFMGGGVK